MESEQAEQPGVVAHVVAGQVEVTPDRLAPSARAGPVLAQEGSLVGDLAGVTVRETDAVARGEEERRRLGAGLVTRLWSTSTGQLLHELNVERRQVVAAIARGGRLLLARDREGSVQLWNLSEKPPVGLALEAMEMAGVPFAFQGDGHWVLGTSWDRTTGLFDIRLWDIRTGRPVGAPRTLPGQPKAAAFRADGRTTVLVTSDGSLTRWVLPTPLEGHADRIALWARVVTGEDIGEDDIIRPLDGDTWRCARRQLENATDPL
jgi:WD40 repeat protein